MNDFEDRIDEIRGRAIEQEEKELFAKAERLWPGDKKRQEEWVYKKLNAIYGVTSSRTSPLAPLLGGEGRNVDEVLNLPLSECEISFGFKASGFRRGDCLADILKRDNA